MLTSRHTLTCILTKLWLSPLRNFLLFFFCCYTSTCCLSHAFVSWMQNHLCLSLPSLHIWISPFHLSFSPVQMQPLVLHNPLCLTQTLSRNRSLRPEVLWKACAVHSADRVQWVRLLLKEPLFRQGFDCANSCFHIFPTRFWIKTVFRFFQINK